MKFIKGKNILSQHELRDLFLIDDILDLKQIEEVVLFSLISCCAFILKKKHYELDPAISDSASSCYS